MSQIVATAGGKTVKGRRQEGRGECLLDVAGHCAQELTAVVVACASQLTRRRGTQEPPPLAEEIFAIDGF